MKFIVIGFLFIGTQVLAQQKLTAYLLPGQGSDSRVFKNIHFEENIDTINIHYPVPFENESMAEYAVRISEQIDTTQPFVLIGVSLGG
ncbi:MAG: hypothetical protein IPH42_05355 [Bacteroidetes bacterium]|nr:hypothetical protein [Bacteroidota bacterium]MBP8917563.1 hypothetical protein [Chitinophagales bacterium]MBP9190854.1 hypothetical protein [Chitinophagales bacterium]MBP9796930.1 hypothetical protein [Chitinophagales bacterium]